MQTLVLGLIFILLGMLSDAAYACAASGLARLMAKGRAWSRAERRLSGGTMIMLGVGAALGERPPSG